MRSNDLRNRLFRHGTATVALGFLACASPGPSGGTNDGTKTELLATPILRPGESLGATYTLTFGALGSGTSSLDGTGVLNSDSFAFPAATNLRLYDPWGSQADGVYRIASKNAPTGAEKVGAHLPTRAPKREEKLFGGGTFDGTAAWLGHSRFLPGKAPAVGKDSPPETGTAWDGSTGVAANSGGSFRADNAHFMTIPVAHRAAATSAFVISAQIYVPSHAGIEHGYKLRPQPYVDRGLGVTSPGGAGNRQIDFAAVRDKWSLLEIRADFVTDGAGWSDSSDDWGTVGYTYYLNGVQVDDPELFELDQRQMNSGTGPLRFAPHFGLTRGWQGDAPEAFIDNLTVSRVVQPNTVAYRTSWIGETVLAEDAAKSTGTGSVAGERSVPKTVSSIWVNPNATGDALIYANTPRDEGMWHTGVYRYQSGVGTLRPFAALSYRAGEAGGSGGLAITGDDKYVYASILEGAVPGGRYSVCVNRFEQATIEQDDVPFNIGLPGGSICLPENVAFAASIRGLAVSSKFLFVSYKKPEGVSTDKETGMLVYDMTNVSTAPIRTPVVDPGAIAYSPPGPSRSQESLWIIVHAQVAGNGGVPKPLPGAPKPFVQEYTVNPSGTLTPTARRLEASEHFVPMGLTVDRQGRLYVANDAKSAQQIMVYDTNQPTTLPEIPSLRLGDAGGVYAKRGAYGPSRFEGPVAIAVDNSGNYYVASDGMGSTRGREMTDVRRFNASKQLEARMISYPYMSAVVPDPLHPGDLYGVDTKYTLDLSANLGPGQEWSPARTGRTVDRSNCADDGRIWSSRNYVPLAVRDLGNPARKYLYTVGTYDHGLGIYRFDSDPASSIARPVYNFVMTSEVADDPTTPEPEWPWPPGQPNKLALWRDATGSCNYEAGEYLPYPYPGRPFRAFSVAEQGDLWAATPPVATLMSDIRRYRFLGFGEIRESDGGTSPWPYDLTKPEIMPVPRSFEDLWNIHYVAATDTLYVLGRSKRDDTRIGDWFIAKYVDFHKTQGAVDPTWRTPVPDDVGTDCPAPQYQCHPAGLTVAGDRVYVTQPEHLRKESGRIRTYDASTGRLRNVLLPGREVAYRSGTFDVATHPVSAIQLQDGRRFVFAEEMGRSRALLYRDFF